MTSGIQEYRDAIKERDYRLAFKIKKDNKIELGHLDNQLLQEGLEEQSQRRQVVQAA
jgi:hypothetical protein